MISRIESTLLKRTMRVLLALAMALYFAPGLLLAPQKAWADGGTATVSNLADLKTAIDNSSVNTIVVTTTIDLPNGTIIDGSNKTIQVATPYVNEEGARLDNGYSRHNVFTVNSSGAVVTLKNMTIFGGFVTGDNAGGVIVNSGTLMAENVTIARSYRGLYIGSSATASLTNCNIVRNVCGYGGGAVCEGGTLVMDGCSLSENRSTSQGGGAIEVKSSSGKFYANNTVIANNCSSEIGGAVNVYGASVYLMNCTVTGNVTTKDATYYGGGIGFNGGTFQAANSIFLDNKCIPNGNGALGDSDIGLYSSSTNSVKLHYCIYGTVSHRGTGDPAITDACKTVNNSNGTFASYRDDGILLGASGTTAGFSHPRLVSKSGMYALYAPLKADSPATSGGTTTYFDKRNLSAVKMSYAATGSGGSSTNTPLFDGGTTDTQVISYSEGTGRIAGVIGASGIGDTSQQHFTVKLAGQPVNGNVTGITLYGDSKTAGSQVSFQVTPASGYGTGPVTVTKVADPSTTVPTTANGNTYSFIMPDCNVTITVVFEPIPAPPVYVPEPDPTPSVTPSSPTGIDDFGAISGVSDRMEYKLEGADAWTDVLAGVTQLTGLPAGTYLIRYKGYSAYTKVVVAAAPAYSVEVKPAAGGTATADKATAMKGETVTFSATADKDFNLRGWMIGDEFIEANSITMPASDITVEPVFTPVQKLFTAKAKASTDRATLSWKQVEGAVKYRVYLAKADGKLKRVTTIEVPAAEEGEVIDEAAIQSACAYTAKKLKAGIIYKLRVVAVAEDGSKISSSPIAYVTPKGKSYANASKLSVSKKSISLGAGEKAKVSAKVTGLDSKGKKLLKVSGVKKVRYMSSEPTIVKVTKYGNITALRAGTAYVYAIAADGVYKRIKVAVE